MKMFKFFFKWPQIFLIFSLQIDEEKWSNKVMDHGNGKCIVIICGMNSFIQ